MRTLPSVTTVTAVAQAGAGAAVLGVQEELARVAERLRLLRSTGIELPEILGEAGEVAAWSARRIVRGEATAFPEGSGQRDRSGRVIQIIS